MCPFTNVSKPSVEQTKLPETVRTATLPAALTETKRLKTLAERLDVHWAYTVRRLGQYS